MALERIGLGAVLSADSKQFVKGTDRARDSLGRFQKQSTTLPPGLNKLAMAAQRTGRIMRESFRGVSTGLRRVGEGVRMTAMGMLPFTLAVGKSIKQAADFERQMSAVGAITRANEEDFKTLTDKAVQMGIESVFSATQSGEAMEYMGRAGASAQEITAGLSGVMNAAAADSIDLASASNVVSVAVKAMNLQWSEASHVADVLALTSARSNTNILALGESFTYGASQAKRMNIPIEETAAIFGRLADAGLKGSIGGTAFTNMLNKITKPSKKATAFMKKYGLSVTDAGGKMKKVSVLVDEFGKALGRIKDEGKKAAMGAELFGLRGVRAFAALETAGKKSIDALTQELKRSSLGIGAAAEMAERRLDNFLGKLTLFGASVESISIGLFSPLLKEFTPVIEEMTRGLNNVLFSLKGLKDMRNAENQEYSKSAQLIAQTTAARLTAAGAIEAQTAAAEKGLSVVNRMLLGEEKLSSGQISARRRAMEESLAAGRRLRASQNRWNAERMAEAEAADKAMVAQAFKTGQQGLEARKRVQTQMIKNALNAQDTMAAKEKIAASKSVVTELQRMAAIGKLQKWNERTRILNIQRTLENIRKERAARYGWNKAQIGMAQKTDSTLLANLQKSGNQRHMAEWAIQKRIRREQGKPMAMPSGAEKALAQAMAAGRQQQAIRERWSRAQIREAIQRDNKLLGMVKEGGAARVDAEKQIQAQLAATGAKPIELPTTTEQSLAQAVRAGRQQQAIREKWTQAQIDTATERDNKLLAMVKEGGGRRLAAEKQIQAQLAQQAADAAAPVTTTEQQLANTLKLGREQRAMRKGWDEEQIREAESRDYQLLKNALKAGQAGVAARAELQKRIAADAKMAGTQMSEVEQQNAAAYIAATQAKELADQQRADSLRAQIKRMDELDRIEKEHGHTAMTLAKGLLEAIDWLKEGWNALIERIKAGGRWLEETLGAERLQSVMKWVTIFGTVAAALGPVLLILGGIAYVLTAGIIPILTGMASIAMAAFWPVVMIGGALLLAWQLLRQEGETFGSSVGRVWESIYQWGLGVYNDVLVPFWVGLKTALAPAIEAIGAIWRETVEVTKIVLGDLFGFMSSSLEGAGINWLQVGQTVGKVIGWIAKGFMLVLRYAIPIFASIVQAVYTVLETLWPVFKVAFKIISEYFLFPFRRIYDAVMNVSAALGTMFGGDILGGLGRLGIALVDLVLAPIQLILRQILILADAIPGMGDLIPEGVRTFAEKGLTGLLYPEGKAKVATETSKQTEVAAKAQIKALQKTQPEVAEKPAERTRESLEAELKGITDIKAQKEAEAAAPPVIDNKLELVDKRVTDVNATMCVDGEAVAHATTKHQKEVHERRGAKHVRWQNKIANEHGTIITPGAA